MFQLKKFIKKLTPDFLLDWYHFTFAYLGAAIYRFPSKKLIVVGVTGTKGKTTTCNLIAHILNHCGHKTGMATTVNFCIGDRQWTNGEKQTMLGRFKLQKLLRRMVNEGCEYAVIETSSEGVLQYRHRTIDYNVAVFTNLTPEHIERHGNFENYRAAKIELFKKVAKKEDGIGIYNLDDKEAEYFLSVPIKKQIGYCVNCQFKDYRPALLENKHHLTISSSTKDGVEFMMENKKFSLPLVGEFNVYNAGAAICVALSQNIDLDKIQKALSEAKPIAGRMEKVEEGQDFTAIVDYSYEPASFEYVLKTVKIFNPKKTIVVFGSAGGGRDRWRRPKMGELADQYADILIVTTDDPYDEKPEKIVSDILGGVLKNLSRGLKKDVFKIVDRRTAIKKAVELADAGDLILFAGKGGEKFMNIKGGKKIPWDETEIVREEIRNKITHIPVVKI